LPQTPLRKRRNPLAIPRGKNLLFLSFPEEIAGKLISSAEWRGGGYLLFSPEEGKERSALLKAIKASPFSPGEGEKSTFCGASTQRVKSFKFFY